MVASVMTMYNMQHLHCQWQHHIWKLLECLVVICQVLNTFSQVFKLHEIKTKQSYCQITFKPSHLCLCFSFPLSAKSLIAFPHELDSTSLLKKNCLCSVDTQKSQECSFFEFLHKISESTCYNVNIRSLAALHRASDSDMLSIPRIHHLQKKLIG